MFPSLARIDTPNSEVKLRSMYPQIVERSTLRSIAVSGGIFTMLQRVGQSERLSIRDGSASLVAPALRARTAFGAQLAVLFARPTDVTHARPYSQQ